MEDLGKEVASKDEGNVSVRGISIPDSRNCMWKAGKTVDGS